MTKKPNIYDLSRAWFNWCFENPEKIKTNHTALYFFIIEHCNRLGWKEKFGLPTSMAKEAIGIKSYNTYIDTLNDLVLFGFIIMVEKCKNQYSTNIVALSNFNKTTDSALDKAFINHVTKQSESNSESISSIDKQIHNNTNQQINNCKTFFYFGSNLINMPLSKWLLENKKIALETWCQLNNSNINDVFKEIDKDVGKMLTDEKHAINFFKSTAKQLQTNKNNGKSNWSLDEHIRNI